MRRKSIRNCLYTGKNIENRFGKLNVVRTFDKNYMIEIYSRRMGKWSNSEIDQNGDIKICDTVKLDRKYFGTHYKLENQEERSRTKSEERTGEVLGIKVFH